MTSSSDHAVGFAVAVVGAGPAGLAAAVAAADAGVTVAVLDLGDRIGGQYYRHSAAQAEATDDGPFHHGWHSFRTLRERFRGHVAAGRVVHLARHAVWSIQPGSGRVTLCAVEGERERLPRAVHARAVIIATGAYDRHVPFPGWTLTGVMAGGGAQALLKGSGVAPGRRAVVAGTGPFLFPVADGLLAAGVQVAEIVEANSPWGMARFPGALPGAMTKLPEALGYCNRLSRHRVPYRMRHAVVAAHGGARLEAVTVARVDADWKIVPGSQRRIGCDLLTVGYGFSPQVELGIAAGCDAALGADGSLVIATDGDGRTSCPGVYAAGETTGVGGADLAIAEGLLCGEVVAADLGSRPAIDQAARRRLRLRLRGRALRKFAEALHRTYPVRDGWMDWLDGDTLVCRCEEVSYASVRSALVDLGAGDVRTVRLLARPGMGWCQGRMCGSIVAGIAASHAGRSVAAGDLTATSRRVIGTPVPLGHLAALDADQARRRAQ